VEIEGEIERLGALLEDATEEYAERAEAAAYAEVEFKVEHAKAYLRTKGTVPERAAWADYRTEEHLRKHKLADALLKATRERLTTLRAQLDYLRSLNANVRHQVGPN
jgi:DNA repair exonuclease SbcCD ATPase subunit